MNDLTILIVGGGIGGLTAALALAKTGHRVLVFEQASEPVTAGAGIQLSPNCTRVLHHLGLEQRLKNVAFLPEGTQFRHWRSGRVITESPLGATVEARYGAPYYHIHRGDLLRVLSDAVMNEPRIQLYANTMIDNFTQQSQSVECRSGEDRYTGDLLVGADGIHSIIRSVLWGSEQPRFNGNVAWRALVPAHRLPAGLIRPMSTVWWGPGRHFVHYYVRQGDLVNCVCVVEKQGWEVESWTAPGEQEELQSDFAGWHQDIQTLIDHVDAESLFKWALFDRPPMPAWGKDRVTLLGDACHPTLPFMAQGAAMSIEDAAVLANCLGRSTQVADGLLHYEDLRRQRTAEVQRGSRRNARIFHLAGARAWLRDRAARRAGGATMDRLFSYNALEVLE